MITRDIRRMAGCNEWVWFQDGKAFPPVSSFVLFILLLILFLLFAAITLPAFRDMQLWIDVFLVAKWTAYAPQLPFLSHDGGSAGFLLMRRIPDELAAHGVKVRLAKNWASLISTLNNNDSRNKTQQVRVIGSLKSRDVNSALISCSCAVHRYFIISSKDYQHLTRNNNLYFLLVFLNTWTLISAHDDGLTDGLTTAYWRTDILFRWASQQLPRLIR